MMNEKTVSSLKEKIAKEKEKLQGYEAKREEIDAKIKACKATIAKLEMTQRTEQMTQLSGELAKKGISIDEIVAAVSSGDFLSLQERLEQNAMPGETDGAEA